LLIFRQLDSCAFIGSNTIRVEERVSASQAAETWNGGIHVSGLSTIEANLTFGGSADEKKGKACKAKHRIKMNLCKNSVRQEENEFYDVSMWVWLALNWR
jgi:CRISPR/Cas system CMR-associated protein Cmr3 (group 5 of RAMP superfamily)